MTPSAYRFYQLAPVIAAARGIVTPKDPTPTPAVESPPVQSWERAACRCEEREGGRFCRLFL